MPRQYPFGPPEDESELRKLCLWEIVRLARRRPLAMGVFYEQMELPAGTTSRCLNHLYSLRVKTPPHPRTLWVRALSPSG